MNIHTNTSGYPSWVRLNVSYSQRPLHLVRNANIFSRVFSFFMKCSKVAVKTVVSTSAENSWMMECRIGLAPSLWAAGGAGAAWSDFVSDSLLAVPLHMSAYTWYVTWQPRWSQSALNEQDANLLMGWAGQTRQDGSRQYILPDAERCL